MLFGSRSLNPRGGSRRGLSQRRLKGLYPRYRSRSAITPYPHRWDALRPGSCPRRLGGSRCRVCPCRLPTQRCGALPHSGRAQRPSGRSQCTRGRPPDDEITGEAPLRRPRRGEPAAEFSWQVPPMAEGSASYPFHTPMFWAVYCRGATRSVGGRSTENSTRSATVSNDLRAGSSSSGASSPTTR
jgi:hypothetical protein